jgi:hypothetical protein
MGLPSITAWRFFAPGTRVEVRSRFRQDWVRGFEVAEAEGAGYRLRRLSDNALLPVVFAGADLRTAGAGPARRAPVSPRLRSWI